MYRKHNIKYFMPINSFNLLKEPNVELNIWFSFTDKKHRRLSYLPEVTQLSRAELVYKPRLMPELGSVIQR